MPYVNAESICESLSSQIIKINNDDEMTFAKNLVQDSFWVIFNNT